MHGDHAEGVAAPLSPDFGWQWGQAAAEAVGGALRGRGDPEASSIMTLRSAGSAGADAEAGVPGGRAEGSEAAGMGATWHASQSRISAESPA